MVNKWLVNEYMVTYGCDELQFATFFFAVVAIKLYKKRKFAIENRFSL